jgi:hypothetical protein
LDLPNSSWKKGETAEIKAHHNDHSHRSHHSVILLNRKITMSYKQGTSSNRDALFGSAGGDSASKKKKKASSKKTDTTGASSSATSSTSNKPAVLVAPSKGYKYEPKTGGKAKKKKPSLSGEAKTLKMKEANEYRDKAKKTMQRGLFSTPDPLAASSFYKRAADYYELCGEEKLERHARMNSADCQNVVGAYATAAAEYARAAELVRDADDEPLDRKREIGKKLHLSAADAWKNMNEPAKAAASKVQAALALIWGDEASLLPKLALEALEESVEAHVPDPLNPYARYRQTGVSVYVDPESEEIASKPSARTLELARQHIVTRAYAHESVQEIVYLLVSYGEYASALYAAGAASAILSQDSTSSVTLSRAFCVETILQLAMGDPIAAEENFLSRHVQKTSYLNSRECKLSEDFFRAVKTRDADALEEARSPSGSNRAALNNLHECFRELVTMIRLNGVARKGLVETKTKATKKSSSKESSNSGSSSSKPAVAEPEGPSLAELASRKTGYEVEGDEAEGIDTNKLEDELDGLDFGDDSEEDLSDDDIDLR